MCPSAPRVCSEPGDQKPVLSLSLDRIQFTEAGQARRGFPQPSDGERWLAQTNYDALMTHHTTENTVKSCDEYETSFGLYYEYFVSPNFRILYVKKTPSNFIHDMPSYMPVSLHYVTLRHKLYAERSLWCS